MGENSAIEWTHHTFNPWWGCQRVSPGCEHCYAEKLAKRVHGTPVWGPTASRRIFGDSHWAEPLKWNARALRMGERHRVFCASMADVFEDRPELVADRVRLANLIEATPSLDWLLLTKRPQNMVHLAQAFWPGAWPSNVWAGTTVEDQQRAEERIPWLQEVPARVRFLSCEPLLGLVDLTNVEPYYIRREREKKPSQHWPDVRWDALRGHMKGPDDMMAEQRVHWVIAGGESGPGARPMNPNWARSLRDQCVDARVPFHFKQFGGVLKKKAGRELDGRTWDEVPA